MTFVLTMTHSDLYVWPCWLRVNVWHECVMVPWQFSALLSNVLGSGICLSCSSGS